MKYNIRVQFILIFGAVILSACGTPKQVRTGAEFSAVQLALLETELHRHANVANEAVKERRLRILKGHSDDFDLKTEIEDQLYITHGDSTQLSELVKIIQKYEERYGNLELLEQSELMRLKELTNPLAFSSESFSKAQQALTDLADEGSANEQFDFFLKYALDVQTNIETQRKEEEKVAK